MRAIPRADRRSRGLAAAVTILATAPLLPVLLAGPAQAAPSSIDTRYRCSSGFGAGSSAVTISADFPSAATSGSAVASRTVRVRITVPKNFVKAMRAYGVDSVSGKASGARYRVGAKKVARRGLRLPAPPVPASGPMVLGGRGTAAGFTAPAPGTYAVRVPLSFDATVVAHLGSDSIPAQLSCRLADGAPSRISTLTVS